MEKIPDVMESASTAYKLLLENEKVRVLDIRLKPGEKAPMHNHPHDHVVYVIKDAKFKITSSDGTFGEFDLKEEQVVWMKAGSHEAENIGKTDGHNIVLEIK